MLFPSLCAVFIAAALPIPGSDVDHAADDRAIFARIEAATAALADKGPSPLDLEQRLEQCKRTEALQLSLPGKTARGSVELTGDEAYRRAARAAVLISTAYKCEKCTKWHHTLASGFAVSAEGIIATNHHVAASPTGDAMGVMTAEGRFLPVVEVLATNKSHDVALIRVEATDLSFLPLRDDAPAGTPVRCYSHPANTFGCLSEGVITRYFKMREPERAGAIFLQTTADYARGSSGGPLIDAYGNAVGMVASTSPVFTSPPNASAETSGKSSKPATPSQQMVRHNCSTARALLELTRAK